jgi:hypothetical protein
LLLKTGQAAAQFAHAGLGALMDRGSVNVQVCLEQRLSVGDQRAQFIGEPAGIELVRHDSILFASSA